MAFSFSLDTNLLIYAFDQASPTLKQQRSRLLADRGAAFHQVLALQCLNEFCSVTQRKRLLDPAETETFVRSLLGNFIVVPATETDVLAALQIRRDHGFSHWDSLLLATCLRSGVSVFFSEDLHDDFLLHGMQIVNPFLRSDREIEEILGS